MRTKSALTCSLLSALFAACEPAQSDESMWGPAVPAAQVVEAIEVPPPPFSEGVFPCSDCHDPLIATNTRRRKLKTAHQEIELRHDAEHRWCLDCHSAVDHDKLHLASGELIDFTESYKLCG